MALPGLLPERLPKRGVKMSRGSRHLYAIPVPGPQTVVMVLPAEIDITNAGQVQYTLTRSLGDGTVELVADGSGTFFCASSGVAALLAAHRRAAAAGVQLRIASSPALRRVFELTGADQLLDTYPTLAAALGEGTGRLA
jgi:anti-sigma B factor antagonist